MRFWLMVSVLQSVQFQVKRSFTQFFFCQQFAKLKIMGGNFSGVTFLLGQGVGMHGQIGINLSRLALQGTVCSDTGGVSRYITSKFEKAQSLQDVGYWCCGTFQVVYEPGNGSLVGIGLCDFAKKIRRLRRTAVVEHAFCVYFQCFVGAGKIEIGASGLFSPSMKSHVDMYGVLKMLERRDKAGNVGRSNRGIQATHVGGLRI